MADGRAMVNLGSSARTAPGWNNLDFSWLLRLGRFPRLCSLLYKLRLLSPGRYERIGRLPADIVIWNLAKGVPFPDSSFDVVYHCHVLEHIDRTQADHFIQECFRVAKPGGTVRIVVPDLEVLARRYVQALDTIEMEGSEQLRASAVSGMIDQMVVRVPAARKQQPVVVRLVEHVLIGNTFRSGELHRWMYDRHSLSKLLSACGFVNILCVDAHTSRVAGWDQHFLDIDREGVIYKQDSLFVEATKP